MQKSNLLQKIGNIAQLGGTRHYTLADGWARNMRAIDVNTGAGLQYTVLPERGLDISLAGFKGQNLVYLTCNGETNPSFYEPNGIGWLHTFAGGLLTTCGLTNVGGPCTVDGEQLGLHGRYSTIPAKKVNDLSGWVGDKYEIRIQAEIEEGRLFGYRLLNKREIFSMLGENKITITDTITNMGNKTSPLMILYHFNLGYPLLDSSSEIIMNSEKSWPREEASAAGLKNCNNFPEPIPNIGEEVFFHQLTPDNKGMTEVSIINKKIKTSLTLRFNKKELPYLTQWKMAGLGEYVLGLEPCNVPCKNRETLINEKSMPVIEPGQTKIFKIEIEVKDL